MTAQKSSLATKIDNFLKYMEVERGSSPLTIRNYHHYLKRFDEWICNNKSSDVDVEDINIEVVRDFRQYLARLEDNRGGTLSKKTQGYHVIALRSFLKWLVRNDEEVLAPDKLDIPKTDDRQIKYLSGEQVDRLLNAPTLSNISGKRDKAILEMFFSTGLRVSELVKLDQDKVNLDRREFGVVGKGGKARVVFLSRRSADWIAKYLEAREDHFKPLFVRHDRRVKPDMDDEDARITPRSIQRMIKKYVRKVKLPVDATPHILRHSFATDLLVAGADIRSVQEMLGHKNIQTTQVYTHVTHKHLKEVHESFHGKGGD